MSLMGLIIRFLGGILDGLIQKWAKTGVTKNWSFSGRGPTPENDNIFFEFVSMLVKLSENIFVG